MCSETAQNVINPKRERKIKIMSRKAILFIHGLGSCSSSTWGMFEAVLRADNALFSSLDIYHFEYKTSCIYIPGIFGKQLKLQDLAEALKTMINTKLAGYSEIVLVCHSMGGLIARRYLLDEVVNKRRLKVQRVLFYAVPHTGAGIAGIGSFFSPFQVQIKQLCKNSDFLHALNNEWEKLNLNYAFASLYITGGQDKVVSVESSKHYLGNTSTEIAHEHCHADITCPVSAASIPYLLFKEHVTRKSYTGHFSAALRDFVTTVMTRSFATNAEIEYRVAKDIVSLNFKSSGGTSILEYDAKSIKDNYWDCIEFVETKVWEARS